MPRLLLFAPFERVVISAEGNNAFLLGMLESVNTRVPPDVVVPDDALSPLRWAALAVWHTEEGDEGQTFQQKVTLTGPSGHIFINEEAPFVMTHRNMRSTFHAEAFPVTEVGEYSLKLFFRPDEGEEWKEIANYPILGRHKTLEEE